MKKIFILGLVVLVGLLVWNSSHQKTAVVSEATPSPTTDMNNVDESLVASPDNSYLKAGGSSYSDSQGVFGFLYPNDYAIDHQEGDKYTRISKRGATQKGQTEIYDGVIVSFERVDLGGKTLSDWVDQQIQLAQSDAPDEALQTKKQVVLNGYAGFTYQVREQGVSTYTVLRKDPNSDFAVSFTDLVADPQQKGYQQEVDAILSTLELRK